MIHTFITFMRLVYLYQGKPVGQLRFLIVWMYYVCFLLNFPTFRSTFDAPRSTRACNTHASLEYEYHRNYNERKKHHNTSTSLHVLLHFTSLCNYRCFWVNHEKQLDFDQGATPIIAVRMRVNLWTTPNCRRSLKVFFED